MGAYRWLIAAALTAAPATAADAPGFAALAMLQPGAWRITSPSHDTTMRAVCLGDARQLLQLRHPAAMCSRFVIADGPRDTTVHYTCPGVGHARTELHVESSHLVRIDTQGIGDNMPFDWRLEARWIGECPAPR